MNAHLEAADEAAEGRRLLAKGWQLVHDGELEQAFEIACRIPNTNPARYFGLVLKAEVLRRKRRFDEAAAELARAIALHPTRPDAYVQRGWVWVEKSRPTAALEDALRAQELLTDDTTKLAPHVQKLLTQCKTTTGLNTVRALADDGRLGEALAKLTEVPDDDSALCRRLVLKGSVLRRMRRHREAEAELDRAVSAYDDPTALIERGWLRVQDNRPEAGLEDALRVRELLTEDDQQLLPQAAKLLTRCYTMTGQLEDALSVAESALETDPDNPDLHVNRGRCLVAGGRFEEALAEAKRAFELQPDHHGAYDLAEDATYRGGAPDVGSPGGRLHHRLPLRPHYLSDVPLRELVGEFLARDREDGCFKRNDANTHLGCLVLDHLSEALDRHENRFSKQRYANRFASNYATLPGVKPDLKAATVVELGCGNANPFGFLFLLLMLGARRGVAIDMDHIVDESRAARALAECASYTLVDPGAIVGDYPITRAQMLKNIASFDLSKLSRGDPAGMDASRLRHQRESVVDLSLADGEADLVISGSLLEHLPDVDSAVATMARITPKGGLGIHVIDYSDHRRATDATVHPLAFLESDSSVGMVQHCNRLRPSAFRAIFAENGFDVVSETPFETIELTDEQRSRFVMPYRAMPLEELSVLCTRIVVKRR